MRKVTYGDLEDIKNLKIIDGEEEEKGDSYLFSYDTLKAVFEGEESEDSELRINQFWMSIYRGELCEDLVTISCKIFDREHWLSDIDEEYYIELEYKTFLDFVDDVKAVEEEILEDMGNLLDYHNEKGQELTDIYNEIKKNVERD